MPSAIRIEDDKIEIMNDAIDLVQKKIGLRPTQKEFFSLLLNCSPESIADLVLKNMGYGK